MRRTFLITLMMLLVAAPVAVGQQLQAASSADQRQVGKEVVQPAATKVDPATVTQPPARPKEVPTGLESRIGGLPLTGIDLLVISGAALVMTGIGFGLQRMTL